MRGLRMGTRRRGEYGLCAFDDVAVVAPAHPDDAVVVSGHPGPDCVVQMKPNILYYSPNEVRGGIPTMLPSAESCPLALDYGWLTPDAMVLVEHKSLADLAGSLRNRHLADQLDAAKKETNHLWLLVTGVPTEAALAAEYGKWQYLPFMAALVSVLHGLQVGGPLIGVDKAQTAQNLTVLFNQTRRTALGPGRPALAQWRSFQRGDQAEAYARAIPGLGYHRAELMVKIAPTWEVLVAKLRKGPKVLERIEGIGPVMAGRIYRAVVGE